MAADLGTIHDTYTPIHNEVLEALMLVNLSPNETRVLFAVWRKTYGFLDRDTNKRKKHDRISISQLASLTNLHRSNISRALRHLEEKGVIVRDNTSGQTGFSKKFMGNKGNKENRPKKISQPIDHFKQANISIRSGEPESMADLLSKRYL